MVKKQREGCISGAQLLVSRAEDRGHGGIFGLTGCSRGLQGAMVWCSREHAVQAEAPTGAGIEVPPSFPMTAALYDTWGSNGSVLGVQGTQGSWSPYCLPCPHGSMCLSGSVFTFKTLGRALASSHPAADPVLARCHGELDLFPFISLCAAPASTVDQLQSRRMFQGTLTWYSQERGPG